MKRTRRIEIVSYTRRVTVSEGGKAPAETDGSSAIDLPLAALGGEDGRIDQAAAAQPQAARRRAVFSLRDLLRLCRSWPKASGE